MLEQAIALSKQTVECLALVNAAVGGSTSTTRRYRVLIADDHAVLRLGLKAVLQADLLSIDVVEASCLQDALELYELHRPVDLVLLDLNMADCRGLQGLRRFTQTLPEAKIAVLSATQDEFVVRQAQALGAAAYIAKSHEPAMMSRMVQALLHADTDVEDQASGGSGLSSRARTSTYDRVAELGARHLEILDLVLFGCSNQEISNATKLSLGTVKNYVSTILLSLDVKSRSHLISLFR